MVKGIELFREQFADFKDQYVLIGGTASSLAMEELGAEFRGTKDLDIVLCIEALNREFALKFWEFVKQGGYENQQTSSGKRRFYRFSKPTDRSYPVMLELFSRVPDALQIAKGAHLTPIPLEDEVSSLSAILLDEEYYRLIHKHRRIVKGLTIIGAECLIPLKAKAYLDLMERKNAGENIDSKDIRKHKNDIFRLFTILDPSESVNLGLTVKSDLKGAFALVRTDNVDLKALGVKGTTTLEILTSLETFYKLGD